MNHNDTVTLFNKYKQHLDSFHQFKDKHISGKDFSVHTSAQNAHLKRGVILPSIWKPALFSIERRLDSKVNIKGFSISKELVKERDDLQIKNFSQNTEILKNVNFTLFIRAAMLSAEQLGINSPMKLHKLTSIDKAVVDFDNTSAAFPFGLKKKNQIAIDDAVQYASFYMRGKINLLTMLKSPTWLFHRIQYKVDDFNLDLSRVKQLVINKMKLTKDEKNSIVQSLDAVRLKIRQIWALPFRIQLIEKVIFKEIMENCRIHSYTRDLPNSTWGRSLTDLSDRVIKTFRIMYPNNPFASIDINSFDSDIPQIFFAIFYAIVHQSTDFEEKENNKFDLLRKLMIYQCKTPFVHGSNQIQFQNQGLASGSVITSLFGTFVNLTIQNYARLEISRGKENAEYTSVVLGDDNLTVLDIIKYDRLVTVYKRLGFTVSLDKSKLYAPGEDFQFLGYHWDSDARPTEDISWFLVRYILPSRGLIAKNYDVPISYAQTYRMLCTSAPIYLGWQIYEYFVGFDDKIYQKIKSEYMKGVEQYITYVGDDMRLQKIILPLSKIYGGWREYNGEVDLVIEGG